MAGNVSVFLLDRHRDDFGASLDEKAGKAMSAMANLHLELTTAMEHVADKLREATENGWGETMEATCLTSIEILQVCANAFAEIREASNGN